MKVSDIRIHDLRRIPGGYMIISGASLPVIGNALNHKDPVFEAVNNTAALIGNNDLPYFHKENFL